VIRVELEDEEVKNLNSRLESSCLEGGYRLEGGARAAFLYSRLEIVSKCMLAQIVHFDIVEIVGCEWEETYRQCGDNPGVV
jgi:hypothetical protein